MRISDCSSDVCSSDLAGMMVIASCQVVPAPLVPPGWFIEAYNPDHIPAIRRIVDASHKHGAKIAVQGVWMMADPTKAQASAIAPHTVLADTQPRSMTIDEIQELIEAHAVAAAHAEQAGADGSQRLHSRHHLSYLRRAHVE